MRLESEPNDRRRGQRREIANVRDRPSLLEWQLSCNVRPQKKNLASALQNNSFTDLDNDLTDRHVKEAELHRRQRFAHEGMKKKHHQAMAHVKVMKAMVDATLK